MPMPKKKPGIIKRFFNKRRNAKASALEAEAKLIENKATEIRSQITKGRLNPDYFDLQAKKKRTKAAALREKSRNNT